VIVNSHHLSHRSKFTILKWPEFALRVYLKSTLHSLSGYDAEVVGDGVPRNSGPFCLAGLCGRNRKIGLGELVGTLHVLIVCDQSCMTPQKALDWVKMRGICWQENADFTRPFWLSSLAEVSLADDSGHWSTKTWMVVMVWLFALQPLPASVLVVWALILLAFHKGELERSQGQARPEMLAACRLIVASRPLWSLGKPAMGGAALVVRGDSVRKDNTISSCGQPVP